MGCGNTRLKEGAVIAIPYKQEEEPIKNIEADHPNNEEASEFSLRECSLIPIITENQRRRASEDPSIMGYIQDI